MDREVQRHLRIQVRTRRGLGAREGGVTAKEVDVVRGMHGLVVGVTLPRGCCHCMECLSLVV